MKEYKKYEFCKSVKCKALQWLDNEYRIEQKCVIESYAKECCHTAKEFHAWLKKHKFLIVKIEQDDCAGCEHASDEPTYDCMAPSLTPCPPEQTKKGDY